MTDYIIISDDDEDDEVEVVDQFINLDRVPTLVDLTNGGNTPPSSPRSHSSRPPTPPQHEPKQSHHAPPYRKQTPIRSFYVPPPKRQFETAPEPSQQPASAAAAAPPPPPQQPTSAPPPHQPTSAPPPHQPTSAPPPRSTASATPPPPWSTPSPGPQAPPAPPKRPVEPQEPSPRPATPTPQVRTQHQQQHTKPTAKHVQSRPPVSPAQSMDPRDLMRQKKELGNKKFRCNHLDEAIRFYKEAGEMAKQLNDKDMSAVIHFNLAMSYDRLGSYNQAADECAAAVKLNDNYIKAHVKRAEIYMSQGKFDEAVICYEHICEIDSTKKLDAMRRIAQARQLSKTARRRDQYEILGLWPNFTLEDLRAAYKKMARTHHPDKHSDVDVVTKRIHERLFKEASEAYTFFRKRFGA